ncbi:MAG: S-adenosylmethionine decarboxylase [Candidatus Niyogibacteria bacterium]|nr:S-adenosylmethionine decarboxylase [Candidatus Niyogibacteria bacterium]
MITKRFHWIFDAEAIDGKFTDDENHLRRVLAEIATICEMTIVGGPWVVQGVPENPGLTAICIVDFSHISIHTFSRPREICVDVFSCKPFDPEKIRAYLTNAFDIDAGHVHYFEVAYPI